ncbi:hypothetical protein GLOTRDRAFT_111940 [Gloeophyllum trabeum ATCC 11539]|uniref:Uncharacterized protein n=1 Tax=Gloeophyllum trabeum (strain ATCC 11539 / FP-39264 / Madison 617) TaxID=670483 RepID=S7Q073_GLOTA|nr:uncharacterized protein GLOTRDRAFT_111940 [Gloeophyllum trabeum ATCC 11539]EPQ53331.1 hypothetical protein GLOTRDRAFT_111940 [Gloeophyllum trabeum ATCC 11539]
MTGTHTKLNAMALVALAALPSVRAEYCYRDDNGFERCSAYSPGVRVAIGVIIAVAFLVFLGLLEFGRRRRAQRANMAYVNGPQAPPYQASNYGAYGGYPPPGGPQYPPPAHNNGAYDPSAGFAPPSVPPPQYPGGYTPGPYAPPQGPPPGRDVKEQV